MYPVTVFVLLLCFRFLLGVSCIHIHALLQWTSWHVLVHTLLSLAHHTRTVALSHFGTNEYTRYISLSPSLPPSFAYTLPLVLSSLRCNVYYIRCEDWINYFDTKLPVILIKWMLDDVGDAYEGLPNRVYVAWVRGRKAHMYILTTSTKKRVSGRREIWVSQCPKQLEPIFEIWGVENSVDSLWMNNGVHVGTNQKGERWSWRCFESG